MLIVIVPDQLWKHVADAAAMAGVSPETYLAHLIVKDMTTIELTLDCAIVQVINETARTQRRSVNQVLVEVINKQFGVSNGRGNV